LKREFNETAYQGFTAYAAHLHFSTSNGLCIAFTQFVQLGHAAVKCWVCATSADRSTTIDCRWLQLN